MNRSRQLELVWQDDHNGARARVLAAMYSANGLACVLYAITYAIPHHRQFPLPIIGGGLTTAGVLLALWGKRAPSWALHCWLGNLYVTIGLVAANSVIPVGVVGLGPGVIMAAMFSGAFCTKIARRIHVGLIAGCYITGAIISSAPMAWVPVTVAVVSAFVVAATLSRLTTQLQLRGATDALTGALNRRTWTQIARKEIARTAGQPLTVALLDLDDFKAINDRQGHLAGDELLRTLAQAWESGLEDQETLGRFGGDEFVLLMPGASAEHARGRLKDLRLRHPAAWTAGVAQVSAGQGLSEALGSADGDLLAAKKLNPRLPRLHGHPDRRVNRSQRTQVRADLDPLAEHN